MAHDNDHYSVFLVIAGIVNGTQPVISEELATSLAVFLYARNGETGVRYLMFCNYFGMHASFTADWVSFSNTDEWFWMWLDIKIRLYLSCADMMNNPHV